MILFLSVSDYNQPSLKFYSAWNIPLLFLFDIFLFKGQGSNVRVLRK